MTSDQFTLLTRAEAKALGAPRYFTGKPCLRGHVAPRKTRCGKCTTCDVERRSRPDVRAEERRRARESYASSSDEHKARLAAYGKAYREANRAKFAEWTAQFRLRNPEKVRLTRRSSEAKRRALKASASVQLTAKELSSWTRHAKKICHWCGAKCAKLFHVDHYVPLSGGGAHAVSNLVIACAFCNLSKKDKDPYEFAKERGRLF